MDIRLNSPHFEPRRVVPKDNRKRKGITLAQKQKLEPSYTPIPRTEEQKQYSRDCWIGNGHLRYPNELRALARNVRFRNRQFRNYSVSTYKKMGKVKTCTHCEKELALCLFDYHSEKKNGARRKSYCYKCRQKLNQDNYQATKALKAEKNRIYYAKNKEKLKETFKRNYQRRAYGITTTPNKPDEVCE